MTDIIPLAEHPFRLKLASAIVYRLQQQSICLEVLIALTAMLGFIMFDYGIKYSNHHWKWIPEECNGLHLQF